MIHELFLGNELTSLFLGLLHWRPTFTSGISAFFIILNGGQKDQNQYQPNGNTSCGYSALHVVVERLVVEVAVERKPLVT